jgi:hypothetical protein
MYNLITQTQTLCLTRHVYSKISMSYIRNLTILIGKSIEFNLHFDPDELGK